MKKLQIAVIGSAGPEEYPSTKPKASMYFAAEQIGMELAKCGMIVVCGGKGGVMESVAKGAKKGGGMVVAETSGIKRFTSNKYIDIEIITGDIAFRGPSQLIGMSDAVIALGGGAGTLQEICVAYRLCKPIVLLRGYGGWTDRIISRQFLDERRLVPFLVVEDSINAVAKALEACVETGSITKEVDYNSN